MTCNLGINPKDVNLNRAQHIVGRRAGYHQGYIQLKEGSDEDLVSDASNDVIFSVISVKVCPHPSIRDSSHNKSSQYLSMV